MARLGFLRRKGKEEDKGSAVQPKPKSLLEELCGDDRELYEALATVILFNPELVVQEGIESYVRKAEEYEKAKDLVRARIAYQVAGAVALYDGNISKAQTLFKKAAEVDPSYSYKKVFEYLSKKENLQKALAVGQEFYAKTGKAEKE